MYPPWTGSFQKVEGGRSFSHYIGYYFVLEPPRGDWQTVNTIVGATTFDKDDLGLVISDWSQFHIDFKRLVAQIVFVVIVTLGLIFTLHQRSPATL